METVWLRYLLISVQRAAERCQRAAERWTSGEPCIHLGRTTVENQSAYVVFRLGTQSAATSEHVTFDESSFPNRKESVVDLDVGDSSDLAGMNSSSSAASVPRPNSR